MLEQYPYVRLNSPFKQRPTRTHIIIISITVPILLLTIIGFAWHKSTSGLILNPTFNTPSTWGGYKLKPLPYFPDSVELETIPSDVAYTAVVLYLVSWKRAAELITSLSYLRENVPFKYPWPIVLFHPGDFDDVARQNEFKRRLYEYINDGHDVWKFLDRIEFAKVDFSLPESVPNDVKAVDPVFADRWPGYQHMCHFFTSQIFDHPRLQNVTYYMRMDSDGYIHGKSCYDPIERMHQRDLVYGYRMSSVDPPFVVHGMYDFVNKYTTEHQELSDRVRANGWTLPDSSKFDSESFPIYYNNLEIVKLDAFRQPQVRSWLDSINSDPMRFYKYRWGDAPLRYATVNMFFDTTHQVEEFCAFPYIHQVQATNNCVCTP